MRTVLITGVSSGVGLGLAKEFISKGYKVIGSVRSEEKAIMVKNILGDNYYPIIFDIRNHEAIKHTIEDVAKILNGSCLIGIINNIGTTEIGPLLEVHIDSFKDQLDDLVVGHLDVIQSFYRFLIPTESKKEPGRIINISSVSGVNSNNFFGCYTAGKHALEGLSKTLRNEMHMFGIKVIVIAPSNIKTAIWSKQTYDLINNYKDSEYYGSLRLMIDQINTNVINDAMEVDEFSMKVLDIFEKRSPANRYTIFKKKNPLSKILPISKSYIKVVSK